MSEPVALRAVGIARGWVGTPYCHQASCRGVGCDCLGLVRGVWRALHGAEPEPVPAYGVHWAESGGAERLRVALGAHLQPRAPGQAAAGDVLLFRLFRRGPARHLGIQTEVGTGGAFGRFVHAQAGQGVCEVALTEPWQRRLVGRFAFPQH